MGAALTVSLDETEGAGQPVHHGPGVLVVEVGSDAGITGGRVGGHARTPDLWRFQRSGLQRAHPSRALEPRESAPGLQKGPSPNVDTRGRVAVRRSIRRCLRNDDR